MGSENYAAPEQWGQGQTDARSDVYAVGATMYHLLANEPPLPAFVPGDRVPLRLRNPSASERIETVIDRAMARERQDRYQSADDMRQALLKGLPPWERLRLMGQQGGSAGSGLAAATQEPFESASAARALPSRVSVPANRSEVAAAMAPEEPPVYCPRCGAGNRGRARYCAQCGQSLEPEVRARLELVRPEGQSGSYVVGSKALVIGRLSPGRAVDVDLGPYDPNGYVSRYHARIERDTGTVTITDLKSSNGTFVNDRRLPPGLAVRLQSGDIVRMGQVELRMVQDR
jgi:hypothetical protein